MSSPAVLLGLLYRINLWTGLLALIFWGTVTSALIFARCNLGLNKALRYVADVYRSDYRHFRVYPPCICLQFLFVPLVSVISGVYVVLGFPMILQNTFLHSLMSYGGNCLRIGTLVLCVDRLIATYSITFYLRYGDSKLFGLVLLLSASFASFCMIIFHICKFDSVGSKAKGASVILDSDCL